MFRQNSLLLWTDMIKSCYYITLDVLSYLNFMNKSRDWIYLIKKTLQRVEKNREYITLRYFYKCTCISKNIFSIFSHFFFMQINYTILYRFRKKVVKLHKSTKRMCSGDVNGEIYSILIIVCYRINSKSTHWLKFVLE